MKKLFGLIYVALFLPFPALADPLVMSAGGWGASEIAAISSARKQVVLDAQSAGFSLEDGYRTKNLRVIEIKSLGAKYVARVEADLVKNLEYKRIVLIVSGDEAQSPRLLALAQRMRSELGEKRIKNQPRIEVIDIPATGALRINRLTDLEQPSLDVELDRIGRKNGADALYVLSAFNELGPVFLVTVLNNSRVDNKTIRTLRNNVTGNAPSLSEQLAEVVREDFSEINAPSLPVPSIVTLPVAAGIKVSKGQAVIIYSESDGEEAVLVTHGVVTEISSKTVQVQTEHPVNSFPRNKLRLSPLPKRGTIISESDW